MYGREAFPALDVVERLRTDHEPLEELVEPLGEGTAAVEQVVDAVERHSGRDAGVGGFEAGLELRVVRRERHHRHEVPARRASGDADEVGVDPQLVGVLTDPRQCPFAVDELLRELRPRCKPVIDREAHPALRGHVVEQRDALLILVTDDPATAVDLHDRRPLRAGRAHRSGPDQWVLRFVDVERVPPSRRIEIRNVATHPNLSGAREHGHNGTEVHRRWLGRQGVGVEVRGQRGLELLSHATTLLNETRQAGDGDRLDGQRCAPLGSAVRATPDGECPRRTT